MLSSQPCAARRGQLISSRLQWVQPSHHGCKCPSVGAHVPYLLLPYCMLVCEVKFVHEYEESQRSAEGAGAVVSTLLAAGQASDGTDCTMAGTADAIAEVAARQSVREKTK